MVKYEHSRPSLSSAFLVRKRMEVRFPRAIPPQCTQENQDLWLRFQGIIIAKPELDNSPGAWKKKKNRSNTLEASCLGMIRVSADFDASDCRGVQQSDQ